MKPERPTELGDGRGRPGSEWRRPPDKKWKNQLRGRKKIVAFSSRLGCAAVAVAGSEGVHVGRSGPLTRRRSFENKSRGAEKPPPSLCRDPAGARGRVTVQEKRRAKKKWEAKSEVGAQRGGRECGEEARSVSESAKREAEKQPGSSDDENEDGYGGTAEGWIGWGRRAGRQEAEKREASSPSPFVD